MPEEKFWWDENRELVNACRDVHLRNKNYAGSLYMSLKERKDRMNFKKHLEDFDKNVSAFTD
jgi:hypothetical protein